MMKGVDLAVSAALLVTIALQVGIVRGALSCSFSWCISGAVTFWSMLRLSLCAGGGSNADGPLPRRGWRKEALVLPRD